MKKTNISFIVLALLVGTILGGFLFGGNESEQTSEKNQESNTIWTCSMHPQIRMNKKGLCPICSMELVPLGSVSGSGDASSDQIYVTNSSQRLGNIQTTAAKNMNTSMAINLFGRITNDERNDVAITTRFSGRIEKLYINFTGQIVQKGETIAIIYSPELINYQQELLELEKFKDTKPNLFEIAKEKIKLLGVSDEQIDEVLKKKSPQINFEIKANVSGVVVSKHISEGNYVKEGSLLFGLSDLEKVWAVFEVYEDNLPYVKIGDKIKFSLDVGSTEQANSLQEFSAPISYIDPYVDKNTRIAKVRADVDNPNFILKPETLVKGVLYPKNGSKVLMIPSTAVLWTGKRSLVYVKGLQNDHSTIFSPREIVLGNKIVGMYIVKEGLSEGEEVVSNGVFKVDASAQLESKISMMSHKTKDDSNPLSGKNSQSIQFKVAGNCALCKERIESATKKLQGVYDAQWNVETKLIQVVFNSKKVTQHQIHQAIATVGHDTDYMKAEDEVYQKLPDCCHFERE